MTPPRTGNVAPVMKLAGAPETTRRRHWMQVDHIALLGSWMNIPKLPARVDRAWYVVVPTGEKRCPTSRRLHRPIENSLPQSSETAAETPAEPEHRGRPRTPKADRLSSLAMINAVADDLLIYAFTATMAHLLMSLGQTLFHRYLGHSRLGGRLFKNHIQVHHVHYAGDHVVSANYLDNGANNTLFFLMPIGIIVCMSYFVLRFDLLLVQLAAMSLSFCGHYYIDNQYHVAGSWLGRFSWFRRKQELHFSHHRHGDCNFAVIDFFWDQLYGTYRRVEAEGSL